MPGSNGAAAIQPPARPEAVKIDGAAGGSRPDGNFPGETPDDAAVVRAFAETISASWRRALGEILAVAGYCAEADAKLTPEQKKELIDLLPFGPSAFSKLVTISKDDRLRRPEIQKLLPPHYTTLHLITTLDEDELSAAVADNVIHAEVKRGTLEKWRKEHRNALQGGQQIYDDGAPSDPAANPSPNEAEGEGEFSADSAANVQSPTDVSPGEVVRGLGKEVASPETAPMEHDEFARDTEHHPLSADEQQQLDAIVTVYKAAPRIVQEHFKKILPLLDTLPIAGAS